MFFTENTPTRLPSPPRVVHGGVGCIIWFLRVFILPHMCVGVFMTAQLAFTVLTAAFGRDVEATVTNSYTSRGGKGRTIYHLEYVYHADGRDYANSDTVGATTYASVIQSQVAEVGAATVRVRYLGFGPFHYHVLTQDHSASKSASELLLFTLFWNGILSMFVY